MIRILFARRLAPVSVPSMIASTRSGALDSVAPCENSTSALTPALPRNSEATLTSSVERRLPCRSFTVRIGEFSGTAITHRNGVSDCLL